MRNRLATIFVVALLAAAGLAAQEQPAPQGSGTQGNGVVDVLPDLQPIWASYSLQDIRIDTARSNDRLVSCKDWTQIDPTPITGQRVLSFTLGSPNLGEGHLRTRRQATPDGWVWYQTTSQLNPDGTCSAVEQQIAIMPSDQTGRWLPLAKFALYEVTEDGGVGDQVACQVKRWCCLVSIATCPIVPPCSLPCQGDCINAGTRDVYPFHFQDQFIPIEGIPSGVYWVEDEINPFQVLIESDYTNNSMFFQIELDQEAGTVRIVQPPENPGGCPSPGCNQEQE